VASSPPTATPPTANPPPSLRARYYDPTTAQFITVDPAFTTTLAPYSYASDNPINMIDPLGLCSWYNLYCEAVQPVGRWVYRNASTISAVTGTLAIGAQFVPVVGQIAGIGLGAISTVTGGLAAYKDASKGAYGMAVLDALGGLAGGLGGTADVGSFLFGRAAVEAWDTGQPVLDLARNAENLAGIGRPLDFAATGFADAGLGLNLALC
jgi:hypothetical protein